MSSPRPAADHASVAVTVGLADVVALLDRYAAADAQLSVEIDHLTSGAINRVSQATVTRLTRLLTDSLLPGVRASAELAALPPCLLRTGIAHWARARLSQPDGHGTATGATGERP